MKHHKIKIIRDRANGLHYWAVHTKDFIIESKKNYVKAHTCELKCLGFIMTLDKLDTFQIFTSDIEYINS